MTNSSDDTTGDLAADLAALRQDVARLAETINGLMQKQTQAAGHRVSEAVGGVEDMIAGAAASAQNRVCAVSGEIQATIERNPLTALLIALGIGMTLGLLGPITRLIAR